MKKVAKHLALVALSLSLILVGCSRQPASQEYYQKGVARYNEGDFPAAVIELKNAIQLLTPG